MTEPSPFESYDPPTVPGMFMHQAGRFGDRVLKLSKHDGRWLPTTWREARENLRRATMGLIAFGVGKGDRIGIVSRTRAEWSDADLAALTAGAVVVGIYPTASAWEQEHIIRHSGCRLIFVEDDATLDKILAIRETARPPRAAGDLRDDEDEPPRRRRHLCGSQTTGARAGPAGTGSFRRRLARRRARRSRHDRLHLRHHRPAEGGDDHPRQPLLHGDQRRGDPESRPRTISASPTCRLRTCSSG